MASKSLADATSLLSRDQTEEILVQKAKDIDKKFYHYTRIDNLKNILTKDDFGKRYFFVSSIDKMNDVKERERHKDDANRFHSFCTCCTKYEKIPLWYLYSGILGKGARIGFPPGKMLTFLHSITEVYPVENNKANTKKPLIINRDFEFYCGWVIYLMDGHTRVIHKNNMYSIENVDEDTIKNNHFIKDYPWEYEREFRIIIKNKSPEVYDRLAIPIPENIIPYIEVMTAPECCNFEKEKLEIANLGISPPKIKKSSLSIEMNLFKNNKNELFAQLADLCDEKDFIAFCEQFCKKHKRGN